MDPPYSSGPFDAVICNNLWEHVPDPLRLLGEIERVLKPGGHVIISTPSRYRTSNLARALCGKPVVMMSTMHATEYTVGQAKEQLRFGGFEVVKLESHPNPSASIKLKVARRLLGAIVNLVGSHHELEETVFYLARVKRTLPER